MRIENMDEAPFQMLLQHLVHMTKYQAMNLLEQFELKPSQAGVLFVLGCEGELSQRQLAQKIGITPPSMTVALRKMEELGYVVRKADEKDQRIIRIALTDRGRSCIGAIKMVAKKMEEIMFRGFSNEERILVRRLLIQMQDNLMNAGELKKIDMDALMQHIQTERKEEIYD